MIIIYILGGIIAIFLMYIFFLFVCSLFVRTDRQYTEDSRFYRHLLFHTQIGVGNRLDGGRRCVKKYLWSFLRTAPAGAGQAVTCSTSGMGLRLK